MPQTRFISGPAGVGKTSHAIECIRSMVIEGARQDQILVLVPHRALGLHYWHAFTRADWPAGSTIDVVTLGGLARRSLETFWPLFSESAGFANPRAEPVFLTIETAQYFMANIVNAAVKTGVFDSVGLSPFRIMQQTLDNLSKAAVNGFTLEQVSERLVNAWGDRHSSRPPVYRASMQVARQFRQLCLERGLVDFSLQIDIFFSFLLREPLFREYFKRKYRYLVVDNLEENPPVFSDFLEWAWDGFQSILLLYDTDAGYRLFLGAADPEGMRVLADKCDELETWDQPVDASSEMIALTRHLSVLLDSGPLGMGQGGASSFRGAFTCRIHKFFPQMVDDVVASICELVEKGVPPREVVVLAPFLGDSLRFALMTRLQENGIRTVSHRPSRALREEPAVRAMLTLMALAHLDWGFFPPVADVADAFHQIIPELDPIRSWLLSQIVYRDNRPELGSFEAIVSNVQERITFRAGNKYDQVRRWLDEYRENASEIPPDLFFSRLFGELLSQPDFGFHANLAAGRVIAQLVESARKFRQTLYPDPIEDWVRVSQEYYTLVEDGLLAALYVPGWHDEDEEAVFLAPAHTFLMRNRWVDYQFWLDIGSNHWWERLEQPLTHPYVLNRRYPARQVWTDSLEFETRQDALRRLLLGLARRCRKQIFMSVSSLSEQGFEQRGPLLSLLQQLVQIERRAAPIEDER